MPSRAGMRLPGLWPKLQTFRPPWKPAILIRPQGCPLLRPVLAWLPPGPVVVGVIWLFLPPTRWRLFLIPVRKQLVSPVISSILRRWNTCQKMSPLFPSPSLLHRLHQLLQHLLQLLLRRKLRWSFRHRSCHHRLFRRQTLTQL